MNIIRTFREALVLRWRRGRRRWPLECAALSALTLTLSGCFSPLHSRMPMVWSGFPQSEGMAYQQQDPFPDPDIGPDTMSRPRGYDRPRTPARKAAEQKLLQGLPAAPENIPPGYPRGGLSSPASVR